MIIFSLAPIMGKKVYIGLEPNTFSLQEYGGSLFVLSSKRQFRYVYYTFYSDQVNWRAVWHFASIHYTKDPTQNLSSSSVQHQTSVITPKNTCVWWFKVRHQKSVRKSLYYLESRKFSYYLSDPTIIFSKFTIDITFQILVSMFVWAFFLYAMKKDASHSSNKLCVRK